MRIRVALLVLVAAVVAWNRLVPLGLAGAGADADQLRYRGADGRPHAFLADFDSYHWLRLARNLLRTGSECDAVVKGECRDTLTLAPYGARMKYTGSLHTAAIALLHRAIATVVPDQPLSLSAFLVPVIVGVLGIVPAFVLGRRAAGDAAGLLAALVVAVNPFVISRTVGSDNDVWNVVLPLALVAATGEALAARRLAPRLAWTLAAAAGVGLQAATWRGWPLHVGIAVAGATLAAAVRMVRRLPVAARDAVVVAGVLWLAGGAGAALAGADGPWSTVPATLVAGLAPRFPGDVSAPAGLRWPDVLGTVGELWKPGRDAIASAMGGPAPFFVAWLGLLALLLPARDWRTPHFVVLIAATVFYRWLITGPVLAPSTLVAVLALPLAAALAVDAFAGGRQDDDAGDGARCLVAVWFLATLFLAYRAQRFLFLLAAPGGLAAAVAVGRVHDRLVAATAEQAPRWSAVVRAGLAIALAGLAVLPIRQGLDAARAALPRMNVAWATVLERLRTETPPDAIVLAWWDYGYFAKYYAERRVAADGGSLLTHVPYWLGRALLAPSEREAVGLLRMLACGSDATPEPEGRRGAWGRLVAAGVDDARAHDLLIAITAVDRDRAARLLDDAGVAPAARDGVLEATHCTPPPTYVVLSSDQIARPGWAILGGWDVRAGTTPWGGAELVMTDWLSCEAKGRTLACPLLTYDGDDPARSRLRRGERAGAAEAPSLLVIADGDGVREVAAASPAGADLGALVEPANRRARIAPSVILRSTFTRLVALEGRGARAFEPFDAQTGFAGERVLAYRVRFDAD